MGSVISIGAFDGVHRGHQHLLATARDVAFARRLIPIAVTFDPDPSHVVSNAHGQKQLLDQGSKEQLLAHYVDGRVETIRFTEEMAALSADEFVTDLLVPRVHPEVIVVGSDFRFGKGAAGDAAALARIGGAQRIEVVAVDPLTYRGTKIAATRIRALVEDGQLEQANALLGRTHQIAGHVVGHRVVGGSRLSQVLSVESMSEACLPASGDYVCHLVHEGQPTRVGILAVEPENPLLAVTIVGCAPALQLDERICVRVIERLWTHRVCTTGSCWVV